MPQSEYDLASPAHREMMFAAAYPQHDIPRDAVSDEEFQSMTSPDAVVDTDHCVYIVLRNDPDMTDFYVLRRRVTTPSFHRSSPDDVPPEPTFEYDFLNVFSSECDENLTSALMYVTTQMQRDDMRQCALDERQTYINAFRDATYRVRNHPELPDLYTYES